ncbi:MAG: sterol desaturase family protein [Alphaproteobacteria bacterium]|nr:MAG: sterol desaturase family protein [Alphaproteobacteria bacterium]
MIAGKLAIVFAVLAILFLLERLRSFVRKNKHHTEDILKNFALWGVNALLSLAVILPVTKLAAGVDFWERGAGGIVSIVLHILLLDFWVYWWHRANHHFDFLWRFHRVHHLDNMLDTSTAVRFHFGEVFLSALARIPVILLFSIPFRDIVIFETVLLMAAFFQHANIRLPEKLEKPLSRIIVTPSIHWVHHHADGRDMHSRYCLLLSIWDHVFHSTTKGTRSADMALGVPGDEDRSLRDLLLLPFHKGG